MRSAVFLLLVGCVAAAPQEAPRARVVLGYLPTWAKREIRYDRFTHLAHAFYGRGFAVPRWYEKPAGKAAHGSIPLRDVFRLIEGGWKRHWDDKALVPYLAKEGTAELVSYEDAEPASLKGRRARELGLPGVFFWSVDQDFRDGDHEGVRAAAEAMRGK